MEVSSQLARGVEAGRHFHAAQPLGQTCRQQRRLHALREADFLFEPDLVRAHGFIQLRVLDRHRRLTREQRQDLDVALAERVELRALEIEDADASILEQHRDDELRADVGDERNVARILRDVGHEQRLLVQRRVPDKAFAEVYARHLHLLAVLHGVLHLELASLSLRSRIPNVR